MDEAARLLIAALADGVAVRRRGARWRGGAMDCDGAAVTALVAAGWVRIEGDALLATPAGRAEARRRAGGAPRRLLAERALPGDRPGKSGPARSVTVNLGESALGWLKARGLVDTRQHAAGERLAADWTRAGLAPRVTMRWDAAPVARGRGPEAASDPSLAQIAAKERFAAALEAVGPGLKDVLWRTACAGEGLEAAERALGWPRRTGRVVLAIALDRLADHYWQG